VSELSRDIVRCCLDLGFAQAGIADAAPTRYADELVRWLEAGRHGSMAYLKDQLAARLDPNLVLPGARSVIMVADLYAPRGAHDEPRAGQGRIARYARGRDYHAVMKKRLHRLADDLASRFPGHRFRAFVDTAPVLEREYAARAGMGWIGRHTLLIHPRLGSYVLLGGLLTTMELAPPQDQAVITDHCGTCTRCIDACPTAAISPYSVDAGRCISYLTIERRGPIDPGLHPAIGDWLYGCDVCQEVCPHNSPKPSPDRILPEYEPRGSGLDLLEVLGWSEEDRRNAFQGSAMKRANLAMMKRNAIIILCNQLPVCDPALESRLRALAGDEAEPELVRETARQALARLNPQAFRPPAPS
jgi:epoxyqueuosine reductase